MESKQLISLFVLLSISSGSGFWLGRDSRQDEIDRHQSRIENAFKHWDQRVGGTSLVPGADSYNLRTFDSGKHWYAVQYDDDWGMKIIGNAEEVYPGLINHLDAMNKLTAHVEAHGPLTFQDGADGDDAKLLRDAGFDVIEKN